MKNKNCEGCNMYYSTIVCMAYNYGASCPCDKCIVKMMCSDTCEVREEWWKEVFKGWWKDS
jgi:hypothetical protein